MEKEFDVDLTPWIVRCPVCGGEYGILGITAHCMVNHGWRASELNRAWPYGLACPVCRRRRTPESLPVHIRRAHHPQLDRILRPHAPVAGIGLEQALRHAQRLTGLPENGLDPNMMATMLGYRNASNGGFRLTLSSLRIYGLITGTGGHIHVTDIGRNPDGEPDPETIRRALSYDPVNALAWRMLEHGYTISQITTHFTDRRIIIPRKASRFARILHGNLAYGQAHGVRPVMRPIFHHGVRLSNGMASITVWPDKGDVSRDDMRVLGHVAGLMDRLAG
ncbi:hypothetical protein [Bifidobacterium felsineum]|uniref:hypothetical protein n=1 Tax=Bifidobacterium felsineum TaxID=2045440 RepID=UPI001BDC0AAF|nr:hypothetical protein [Bifidobacterium felsineum]MBT1164568.1 hypothetical protein [Bifidobacterium felsineum]